MWAFPSLCAGWRSGFPSSASNRQLRGLSRSLPARATWATSAAQSYKPRSRRATSQLNTFRHVNIALVSELAMFARDLGVDVWRAIDAAATKPFGSMKFTSSPGVGGHCLPIDPSYLAWRVKQRLGHTFRFVELANDVNEHMPDYVFRRITATLSKERTGMNGSKILLPGLAYKKGTSDWHESPSIHVADRSRGRPCRSSRVRARFRRSARTARARCEEPPAREFLPARSYIDPTPKGARSKPVGAADSAILRSKE